MAKTILVVHPEYYIRRLVELNLLRNGYNVLTSADANTALQLIKEQLVDLIVMDEQMAELQEALQNSASTRTIPITVLQPDKEFHIEL